MAGLDIVASLQITCGVAKPPWLSQHRPLLFIYVCCLATHRVVTWPADSTSSGSVVEMQTPRPYSKAFESKSAFPRDPQMIWCIGKSEKSSFINFLSLSSRWWALLSLPLACTQNLSNSGPLHLGVLGKEESKHLFPVVSSYILYSLLCFWANNDEWPPEGILVSCGRKKRDNK